MLKYGPTGALNEYQYKGGFFHGIHYGGYHNDIKALFKLIDEEEAYILKSIQKRRIMMDLYETDLTPEVLDYLMKHLANMSDRIYKLAFAAEPQSLRKLNRALKKNGSIASGIYFLNPDQETGKTWLVSDNF